MIENSVTCLININEQYLAAITLDRVSKGRAILGIGAGAMVGSQIGQQLDQRDQLLLGQTVQQTLETAPNNAVGQWQNPNTGNSGTVIPTHTYTASNGAPCREFTQTIYVGGYPEEGYGTACRQADGSWQIVQR